MLLLLMDLLVKCITFLLSILSGGVVELLKEMFDNYHILMLAWVFRSCEHTLKGEHAL